MEEWRDIQGYEGLYQVSNLGRVRSLDRTIETRSGKRRYKGRILKDCVKENGYHIISLWKNGTNEVFFVHKLVAEAFIANPSFLSTSIVEGKVVNSLPSSVYW